MFHEEGQSPVEDAVVEWAAVEGAMGEVDALVLQERHSVWAEGEGEVAV